MKISDDVLRVLSGAIISEQKLRLVGELDRALYLATNKVLEAAGGKWFRKERAHVFVGDAASIIEQIILTGEITIPQDFGYFPTPRPIAEMVIDRANIDPGMRVLAPDAGQGGIAKVAVAAGGVVDCVELLTNNAKFLRDSQIYNTVQQADFLALNPSDIEYPRVVMNPPFEKRADIHHVTHAFQFLSPGGILVSIMAAGILFREDKLTKDFREFVLARKGVIEKLPENSFKESGTAVNTVIVTIIKENI